jgi:hypothetical protein
MRRVGFLFRPVLEWLESRWTPSATIPPPPAAAGLTIALATPSLAGARPAALSGDVGVLDRVFAAGWGKGADFEQMPPPPAPKKFSLGLLAGAGQQPPALDLPPLADFLDPGLLPNDEDTCWRDRLFVEAPLSCYETPPESSSVLPEDCSIVVAA